MSLLRASRLGAQGRFSDAGVLAGLVLVALLFGLLIGPRFFSAANLELMARQAAIVFVAALGMTMVVVAGGIDLSVGSVIALSTVVAALLLREGAVPILAGAGAVAAGAACGLINGCVDHRSSRGAVHHHAWHHAARPGCCQGSGRRAAH